jgi:hypothetical protein
MCRVTLYVLSALFLSACIFSDQGTAQQAACSQQTLAAWCSTVPSSPPPACANCTKTYQVKSYQGKSRCLDYTPGLAGSAIIINDCAQAHPISVEELSDGKHTVVLHAGANVIGFNQELTASTNGSSAAPVSAATATDIPLTLLESSVATAGEVTSNHFFTLDGDSIILASNRTLVVKVQNSRGAAGSPVVLGQRLLGDDEFWDFLPTAGSASEPTSGFVPIGYAGDPYCANPAMCTCRLFNVVHGASEGTVIQLETSLHLSDCPILFMGQGVTLRGDRRGILDGPLLRSCYMVNGTEKCDTVQKNAQEIEPMILLKEGANDIRITNLQLAGPSRSTDGSQTEAIGVMTFDASARNIIDHNDISDWPYIGVMTKAHDDENISANSQCDPKSVNDPKDRPTSAFVARNFIHHNQEQDAGYGTESDWGAYPFIFGNTFVSNRHAIAGGKGSAHTAYRAWNNLVLNAVPLQHYDVLSKIYTHDFDMHGLGPNGFGGIGGDYVDIYQNTFFGTNPYQNNFKLRGDICNYAEFHNNISLKSKDDAVSWQTCQTFSCPTCLCLAASAVVGNTANYLRISPAPDQFNHSNPALGKGALGVGDFDADGNDDLFLATGAAWYYSPHGKVEWRFLSAKTETMNQVLLGDFDGDGRTDVVTIQNGQFMVSWGGVSTWEVLNPNPTGGRLTLPASAISDMVVEHFAGNKIPDIFWADGKTWWLSYGGTSAFKEIQTSGFRVADLRFGDFNHDGKTDVFGVSEKDWEVSYAPASGQGLFSSWQALRPKLSDSVASLIVADFNGDGTADVATDCPNSACWQISCGGKADWTRVSQPVSLSGSLVGVGHFESVRPSDILTWNTSGKCDPTHGQDTQFCISPAATGKATHYSTQDMR